MWSKRILWVVGFVPLLLAFGVDSSDNPTKGFLLTGPKQLVMGTEEHFCLYLHGVQSAGLVTFQLYHSKFRIDFGSLGPRRIDPKVDDYGGCIPLKVKTPRKLEGALIFLKLKVDWDDATTDLEINVKKEVYVSYEKNLQQLIQMDKLWYNPGQLVRFRTLALNNLLQPIVTPPERVWCTDPNDTIVAEWTNITASLGLAQLEFQLSPDLLEGDWKIHVQNGDLTETKEFQVREFPLARFVVAILGPERIPNNAESFNFSVCANYTFGQHVLGHVAAEVKVLPKMDWFGPIVNENETAIEPVTLTATVDRYTGCAAMVLPLSALGLEDQFNTIEVTAKLTEKGSDEWHSATNQFNLAPDTGANVRLDTSRTPSTFQLGLPYFLQGSLYEFEIGKSEVVPIRGVEVEVCVREGYEDLTSTSGDPVKDSETQECANVITKGRGEFTYTLFPENPKVVRLAIMATYTSETTNVTSTAFKTVKPSYSPTGSFASITPLDPLPVACNDNLTFNFYFNNVDQTQHVHYIVTGRGDILAKGTKEVAMVAKPIIGRKSVQLEIPVTPSFSPKASMLAFYVLGNGEVVTAQTDFTVEECFPNPVTIQWTQKTSDYSPTRVLKLHSTPGSLCGLRAVGHSAKPVKAQRTEENILEQANRHTINSYFNPRQDLADSEYCESKKGSKTEAETDVETPETEFPVTLSSSSFYQDAISAFDGAGLLVMSNLDMQSRPCYDYYTEHRPIVLNGVPAPGLRRRGRRDTASSPDVSDANEVSQDVIRELVHRPSLPETLLWSLYTTDANGDVVLEETLPYTTASYVARAFCVSNTAGFGLSAEDTFDTYQPFFLVPELPKSAKLGENLTFKVSLYNYTPLEFPVTLYSSDEFELISASNEQSACIEDRDTSSVEFSIRPTKLGRLNLTFHIQIDSDSKESCRGDLFSDTFSVVSQLLVQA